MDNLRIKILQKKNSSNKQNEEEKIINTSNLKKMLQESIFIIFILLHIIFKYEFTKFLSGLINEMNKSPYCK